MTEAQVFRLALADDLDLLVRLHGGELDASTIEALRADAFPQGLGLLPADAAVEAMRDAVAELRVDLASLDTLAADFAAIYLNNAYGASPYESVWLHDEHLACQQPMFELRELYAAAGLQVDDWRKRYDDHFVLQLQYLARRCRAAEEGAPLEAIGRFIDEHLGYWFAEFAAKVAARCGTRFYAALAVLTAAWIERLREAIEEISGELRLPREVVAERVRAKFSEATADVAPIRFMPGGGAPGW